jgi:cbb3-type cytochrome oxidase maturation protein
VDSSLIALLLLSLFLGGCCWLVFLWAVKKGEFEDIERPKHRMLDDDEDRPGSSRKGPDRPEDADRTGGSK